MGNDFQTPTMPPEDDLTQEVGRGLPGLRLLPLTSFLLQLHPHEDTAKRGEGARRSGVARRDVAGIEGWTADVPESGALSHRNSAAQTGARQAGRGPIVPGKSNTGHPDEVPAA